MEPSETKRGQRWLSNFDTVDQPAARLLLDSLELIGQDQLRLGLQQLAQDLAKTIPTPIALVPVRELASGQSYYKTGRNAKPRLLLPNSFPGSEAIIANIAGTLRRRDQSAGPFVASPSLKNLREARCRSIVFIDDFSGSGDRVIAFHQGYRGHPTLYSWESYGLIEYHVAAYAVTRKAHDRLSKAFGEDNVHLVNFCPTFETQQWVDKEYHLVEKVCREYACNETFALGYQNNRALIVFSHTAPNNLPIVLWQRHLKGRPVWYPFFMNKAVPEDLAPLFAGPSSHEQRMRRALDQLGQRRLATGDWRHEASHELQNVFLVLAALARRPRNKTMVVELTRLSHHQVAQILAACRRWKLVGVGSLRLTDDGRSELKHAKNISLASEEFALKGSDEFYYPISLRVGR